MLCGRQTPSLIQDRFTTSSSRTSGYPHNIIDLHVETWLSVNGLEYRKLVPNKRGDLAHDSMVSHGLIKCLTLALTSSLLSPFNLRAPFRVTPLRPPN